MKKIYDNLLRKNLNDWERNFIKSIYIIPPDKLSQKQYEAFKRIYGKFYEVTVRGNKSKENKKKEEDEQLKKFVQSWYDRLLGHEIMLIQLDDEEVPF